MRRVDKKVVQLAELAVYVFSEDYAPMTVAEGGAAGVELVFVSMEGMLIFPRDLFNVIWYHCTSRPRVVRLFSVAGGFFFLMHHNLGNVRTSSAAPRKKA